MTRTAFATLLAELSDPSAESDGIRHAHNVFALATLADCYSPDGPDSPGAQFLARVAEAVAEHCNQYAGTPEDGDDWPLIVGELTDGDAAHEIANSAVPICTHDQWATFVDLGAYNEDLTGWGEINGDNLTDSVAGVALYMIADRLVRALAEELTEALDTDADNGPVNVWVQETDHPDAPYAINTLEEMRENFEDTEEADDFEGYLGTWTHLTIPRDVYLSDDDQTWVAAQLSA